MKKLYSFHKKVILYKLLELIFFSIIIFGVFYNISVFFKSLSALKYSFVLFAAIYIFKNRDHIFFKDFIKKLEQYISEDISLISIFDKSVEDPRYKFSKELIEAERKRNVNRIENHCFNFDLRVLAVLFFVVLCVIISCFSVNIIKKAEIIKLEYAVNPGNSEVFYNREIDLFVKHNKSNKEVLYIDRKDTKEVYSLKGSNSFSIKADRDFVYYFQIGEEFTEKYKIKVIYPLDLKKIISKIQLPEYLGSERLTKDSFDLEVLEGSKVNLKFDFNNTVEEFEFIPVKDLQYTLDTQSVSFTLEEEISYQIKAESKFDKYVSKELKINVIKDKNPEIKFLIPDSNTMLLQEKNVNIKFIAMDDFRLYRSVLNIFYDDEETEIKEIGRYNSKEIVQEYSFSIKKSGYFNIELYDKKGNITKSKNIIFKIIDDFKSLKNVIKVTQEEFKKIKQNSDSLSKVHESSAEKIRELIEKGNINNADQKMLENINKELKKHYDQAKKSDNTLKDLEEFAKDHELSSEIVDKIKKIRNHLKELMNKNILQPMDTISKMAAKKNINFQDYKKFRKNTDLEAIKENIENTLKLLEKVKKENEEKAVIDYLERILQDLRMHIIYAEKSMNKKDYGTLKGIKININTVYSNYSEIKEFIQYDRNILETLDDKLNKSVKLVFKDLKKHVKSVEEIIPEIEKILISMKEKREKRMQEEKNRLKEKLNKLYDYILSSLKLSGKVQKEYVKTNNVITSGEYIENIKEIINKSLKLADEIIADTFVLEPVIMTYFRDSLSYIDVAYQRGKEGTRISGYIDMTQKKLMSSGINVVDVLKKLQSMESSTGFSEMMEKLNQLNKMQKQLGNEMSQLMSGNDPLENFMDYYQAMQQSIREGVESLSGMGFDKEINRLSQNMAQLERKMQEKTIDKSEFKNDQNKIKKLFREMMIKITDKMKKNEYKAVKVKEREFEKDMFQTEKGKVNKIDNFSLPDDFPYVNEEVEEMIKLYLNSL